MVSEPGPPPARSRGGSIMPTRRIALLMMMPLSFGFADRVAAIGAEIAISERESAEYAPAIAYNSIHDEYLVVWENLWPGGSHDVYAQRVSASGELLSWFVVASSANDQMEPSVAYDPVRDRYLVTWSYDYWGNGSDWDIVGRFIPWSGPSASLNDFLICSWTSGQAHSAVVYAAATQEFLVVWKNNLSAGVPPYISARRVFADGSGFPLGDGFTVWSGTEFADYPDVAYNLARNEYLVTWDVERGESGLDIDAVRLSDTGGALGSGPFTVAGWTADEQRPAIAACAAADQYLVAWQSDQSTGGADEAIYARYLAGDGALGTVNLIDDTTAMEVEVDVACTHPGTQYFLAWQTMYAGGMYGIWGRAAFPDGSLGDSAVVVQPGPTHHRQYPALAGGQTLFLAAWEHQRTSDWNFDIHGRLVHDSIFLDNFESGGCAAWDGEVP
jgi:hypothetical protein